MARSTAQDLINASLTDLGVRGAGETLTASESSDALDALNALIDQWAAESLFIYTITRSTWTIVSNDGTYSVGTGGDVNIARPVFVKQVNFVDTSTDPDTEYPLAQLTEDAYAAIRLKAQTSTLPQWWHYNPTFPTATLNLWPIPTSSTLLGVIYAKTALTEFSTLSTSFSLPPAYERMIVKNLALDLAPSYEREPSQSLIRQAMDAKEVVKRANRRLVDMQFERAALTHSGVPGYNIRTDGY